MELQEVLHPQGLEQQHHVGQVGPLDLGHRGGQELILIGALCVEPAGEDQVLLHLPPHDPAEPLKPAQLPAWGSLRQNSNTPSAPRCTCAPDQPQQAKITGRTEFLIYSPHLSLSL